MSKTDRKLYTDKINKSDIAVAPGKTGEYFIPNGKITPHIHINGNFVGIKKKKKGEMTTLFHDKRNEPSLKSVTDVDDLLNECSEKDVDVKKALNIYKDLFF